MKFTVTPSKPRNPLVAALLHRRAGTHRRSTGAQRQAARMALRRELERTHHPDT